MNAQFGSKACYIHRQYDQRPWWSRRGWRYRQTTLIER